MYFAFITILLCRALRFQKLKIYRSAMALTKLMNYICSKKMKLELKNIL
jgi:hypothetical protein